MMRTIAACMLLLACALAGAAHAQKAVLLYRCTDATGAVTLQTGKPCPKGSTQETRSVEAAPVMPAPVSPVAPVVRAAAEPVAAPAVPVSNAPATPADSPPAVLPLPAAQTLPAERLPPPPLYQCRTIDQDSYLSDVADPPKRCVSMTTTGIDGNSSMGAGQACAMVSDQCQRVPDGAACDAWKQRVREAQSAWTFARVDSADALKSEYERIARIAAESTCGQ